MMGLFFAPAYADDPCKNLFNPNDLPTFTGDTSYGTIEGTSDGFKVTLTAPTLNGYEYFLTLPIEDGIVYSCDDTDGKVEKREKWYFLYSKKADKPVGTEIYFHKVQKERGSTATTYQPYNPLCATCDGTVVSYESVAAADVPAGVQDGTPTPTNPIEPVFYKQGDMILRRIGDYADSYDATTGKITRRVGVKVLNGTEDYTYDSGYSRFFLSMPDMYRGAVRSVPLMSNFFGAYYGGGGYENVGSNTIYSAGNEVHIKAYSWRSVDAFKSWLTQQYAAGTPVTIYYPLATPVEENWPSSSCQAPIKIATTAYNNNAFSSVQTALNSAVSTIKDVVANTITQTAAIAQIASDKQTRPNSECPTGKTCLLVEDMNGDPHWYEIIENIYGLPSGYTALEYIESTGTQYIKSTDMNINSANYNYVLSMDIQPVSAPQGNTVLLSSLNSDYFGYDIFLNASGEVGLSESIFLSQEGMVRRTYTMTVDKQNSGGDVVTHLTNGISTISRTRGYVPASGTWTLFAAADGSKTSVARIFSWKVYQDDTLIKNLVPAKNSSNVVGMYDTVTNTFYTNAGTGTFTAGPVAQ